MGEHVVENPDAGNEVGGAVTVQIEAQSDVGFGSPTDNLDGAMGCNGAASIG